MVNARSVSDIASMLLLTVPKRIASKRTVCEALTEDGSMILLGAFGFRRSSKT
jgi:hypothetical protein